MSVTIPEEVTLKDMLLEVKREFHESTGKALTLSNAGDLVVMRHMSWQLSNGADRRESKQAIHNILNKCVKVYNKSKGTTNRVAYGLVVQGDTAEYDAYLTKIIKDITPSLYKQLLGYYLDRLVDARGYRFMSKAEQGWTTTNEEIVTPPVIEGYFKNIMEYPLGVIPTVHQMVYESLLRIALHVYKNPTHSKMYEGTRVSENSLKLLRWVIHDALVNEEYNTEEILNKYNAYYMRDIRVQITKSSEHINDYRGINKRYKKVFDVWNKNKRNLDSYGIKVGKPVGVSDLGVYLQPLTIKGRTYYVNHYVYGYTSGNQTFYRVNSGTHTKREFIAEMVSFIVQQNQLVKMEGQAVSHLLSQYILR